MFVNGNFTVIGPGLKSAAVPHPDDSHRLFYCVESPESWFEDFGEGQLAEGKGAVRLDPDFAALVDVNGYHVFILSMGSLVAYSSRNAMRPDFWSVSNKAVPATSGSLIEWSPSARIQ